MQTNFDNIMENMEGDQPKEQGSDFFKFPVGSTRIRILTDFVQTWSLYEGKYPNSKYVKMLTKYQAPTENTSVKTTCWAWAIIRGKVEGKTNNDNAKDELKIVQFPYALMTLMGTLKKDSDWTFDEFPMPYDITISNTGEGGARYSLHGSPQRTEVSEATMTDLGKRKPCKEIIDSIMAKQEGKPKKKEAMSPAFSEKDYPQDEIRPEDIPF